MTPNDLQMLQLGLSLFTQGASVVQTIRDAQASGGVTDAQVQQALAQAATLGDQLQAAIDAAKKT